MAEWGSEPIWTPFEEINGGQQFSKKFGAQDLNALAENIAYLYENRPEEDTTAIASDVVEEKTFYSKGKKQTGTMPMLRSLGGDAISIVANTNPTAPNGTLDIYVLSDHKTYVPGSVGDGSYAAQIVEPNAVPKNIAEGITLFGIQGTHKGGITTPTQEKSVTITENGTTEVVADDGYAMSKVTAIVNVPIPETPIFDGTINIESGNTTISGSYIIDASKAYNALEALAETKTYNVDFSAGSVINGDQEKKGFISMTFNVDGGPSIIYGRADGSITAFSSTEHMTGGNGFAPYYNAYEEGNGAMVNFYEGTVCRRDFKELFLSIADVNDLAPTLISFTIDGTSYQAEEGMTWGEWVDSEYNTDGFVFYAGSLCTSSLNYFVENSGGSSATITEGTNYSMSPYGGGN